MCGHPEISWCDLVQQVDVCDRVLDVSGEVFDLSSAVGASEVVVHPTNQDLLWCQFHELLQRLVVAEQDSETRMFMQVDVTKQPDLSTKRELWF